MRIRDLLAPLGALATLATAVDDWMGCDYRDFCSRHREYLLDQLQTPSPIADYVLDTLSVVIGTDKITGSLKRKSKTEKVADHLDLTIWMYQDGIARFAIEEPDSNRFRVSQEPILTEGVDLRPVSHLKQMAFLCEDYLQITGESHDGEEFYYVVEANPFTIKLALVSDTEEVSEVLRVNPVASLYVEDKGQLTPEGQSSESGTYDDLGNPMLVNYDYATSVSLGFFFRTEHLYGIPGREYDFDLKTTEESGPYRLFNRDLDPHWPRNKTELYGSIPYVTGHSTTFDSSVAWLNSADTWVEVLEMKDVSGMNGTYVNFLSEGGMLEFFTFASLKHPARVQKKLAQATGYLALPPMQTLGFQFSKWAPVSADMITERSQNFTETGFPVDVFWLDIEHALWAEKETIETRDYRWFTFNPANFSANAMEKMKDEISQSGRRLVTIIDPHINANDDYFVYADGMALQTSQWQEGDAKNIFVRDEKNQTLFAEAWPGNSTFMDFLNGNARQFWQDQFKRFDGSSSLFYAWNDVNDPCVFNGPIKTMPVQFTHVQTDGRRVLHRDVHNAYGTLEHMSSFKGWASKYEEDDLRPFILSRSYFFGSQKYGPMWTGDTQALLGEPWGSLNEMLSMGVAGHPFGGADIPGYKLDPPQDLWVMMYQLGMFYPFFRAHNEINYQNREPWLQNERIQTVIRDAIDLRYDLIHYIYTMFYQGSSEALPLVRAMWFEFPKDEKMTNLDTQFMFGEHILVCPKLLSPETEEKLWSVNCTFPSTNWYSWYDAASISGDQKLALTLPDFEQGIFVRGGAIIPILQHSTEMSLLHAVGNPITLRVYPDADQRAQGKLYLDDGETFGAQKRCEKVYLGYNFAEGVLSTSRTIDDACKYEGAFTQKISTVTIYGIEQEPSSIKDKVHGLEVTFTYDLATRSVTVDNLDFVADSATWTSGSDIDLLQLIYSQETAIFLE